MTPIVSAMINLSFWKLGIKKTLIDTLVIFSYSVEIKRFMAWNVSEVGPSLNWSSNDPQFQPARYKVVDMDLAMEVALQIMMTLRLIC